MRPFALIFLISLFLSSCNDLSSRDKYQIVPSADGNVYRVDRLSGEIWLIKGNSMEQVHVTTFKIKVGQRYSDEGGYSFTYLGNGKVGDISSNLFDRHN